MDDEKIINDVVSEIEKTDEMEKTHPIKRDHQSVYNDFDNTLTNKPKYADPIKQREQ